MKHPTDKLLTLLGQNAGLHALTGQDRADMLAYGRAVWAADALQPPVSQHWFKRWQSWRNA